MQRLTGGMGGLPPDIQTAQTIQVGGSPRVGGSPAFSPGRNVVVPNVPSAPIPSGSAPAAVSTSQPGTQHPEYKASNWGQGVYTGNGQAQQILTGKNRRYLLIQNQDTANAAYVGFGIIPTIGAGFRLNPGDVFWENVAPPAQAIYIISASGVICVFIEGV